MLVFFASVVLFTGFVPWYLRGQGFSVKRLYLLQFLAVLMISIGSKLMSLYLRDWQIMDPWTLELRSSIRFQGAILLVLLLMPWLVRAVLPVGQRLLYADAFVMALCLAFALMCVDCFLNGCCVGGVCDEFYCLVYPRETVVFFEQVNHGHVNFFATHSLPTFPLHFFLMGVALIVFAMLYWYAPRRDYPGQLALLYLFLCEGGKAFLETWREPYVAEFQWISGGAAVLGLVGLWWMSRLGQNES